MVDSLSFRVRERRRQTIYFESSFPDRVGFRGMRFRLDPKYKALNLAPFIRDNCLNYFTDNKITCHTHANHALSSQVCCLNFLMPLVDQPTVLSNLVSAALGIGQPNMLADKNSPEGRPGFVDFEWNGSQDYLNEGSAGRRRTRGANSTSADAVIRFEHDGCRETLLIEWKYTENYGPPLRAGGNPTRLRRYHNLAFAPEGPIRNDLDFTLEDFFYEPLYQLLREQMLAYQMQRAGEDGADRVRVLHITPEANTAVRKVTSPKLARFGINAFEVFRRLLVRPTDFVSRSIEELFIPLLTSAETVVEGWRDYIAKRYSFLELLP
jgi:hypothetical protein